MKEKINDFIDTLGLNYKASFVPASIVRHKDNINWEITLIKDNQSMVVDFSQGVGRLPNYKHRTRNTLSGDQGIKESIETGYCCLGKDGFYVGKTKQKLERPELIDVLFCLCLDSEAINADSFEAWAPNYGYDEDSRKAEKIFNQCLKIGRDLRRVIGAKQLERLQELFQDY